MNTTRNIELPEEGRDLTVVASVSGGKDSTALILALRELLAPAPTGGCMRWGICDLPSKPDGES